MKIPASELWQFTGDRVLIDVRSPSEFARGHIPGALSMPLFSDDDRAVVGTAYKQISPEAAMYKGLDITGPKMSGFIRFAKENAPDNRLLVHCWRGGKRSESIAWLLRFAGFDVLTVEGGYKAYRRHLLEQLERYPQQMVVLGGKTGSGKTPTLHALAQLGEQVIDLEGLACHKGSAFGWIREKSQPTTEQFENLLYEVIRTLRDTGKPVWVENESRTIGSVYIPDVFWKRMKEAPLLNMEAPLAARISHLVEVYSGEPKEVLVNSFEKIERKLGDKIKEAKAALEEDDFAKAASIALYYYDKTYQYGLDNNNAPQVFHLPVEGVDPEINAKKLIEFYKTHFQ